MKKYNLVHLLEYIKKSIDTRSSIKRYRHNDNNIILYLSLPIDINFSELLENCCTWEKESGWNIAVHPFFYSPQIPNSTIETIFKTMPHSDHIQCIEELDENTIAIYSHNIHQLFGKKNSNFRRLCTVLRGKKISIRAADTTKVSPNLESIEKKISRSVEGGKIISQVEECLPEDLHVRKIGLDIPNETVLVTYDSAKFNNLKPLRKIIKDKTGWQVQFNKKIDQGSWTKYIQKSLPNSLPFSQISFYRDEEYFLIRCKGGDFTHKKLLEETVAQLNQKMPVEVRFELLIHDNKIRDIINDVIPQEWAVQKINIHQVQGKVILVCTNHPQDKERILAEVSERTGLKVILEEDVYDTIEDEEILAQINEIIPKSCGFSYAVRHAVLPQYRIFIARYSQKVPLKQIKKLLQSKQVVVKITEEESHLSKHVKQVLSRIEIDTLPTPCTREVTHRYAQLTGYGACQEVGRSCFYLELSGLRILLDCGASFSENPYPEIPPKVIADLDYVFLSHAHTDHCALIPWLYRQGCKAQLISTAPTFAIANLMMKDFVKVQKKHRGEEPAYDGQDIINAFGYSRIIEFDERYPLGNDIFFTFKYAAHILGAGAILFEDNNHKLFYSGDISLTETRIMQPAVVPKSGLHHVIMETTYGGRQHPDRKKSEEYFFDVLLKTLENGGTVLIPCFAVGRSQEILMLLSGHSQLGYHKKFPVYVDGMITKINDIYRSYLASSEKVYFTKSLKNSAKNVFTSGRSFFNNIGTRENMLKDPAPKIILTTSGMCEGLARFYLPAFIEDEKNLLMLVGYQTPENTGGYLLAGHETIEINGKSYNIKMQIEQVSFSAHADENQLIEYLAKQNLQTLISVHGDVEAMESFTAQAQKDKLAKKIIQPALSEKIIIYDEDKS